jgi:hypothetical protein
MCSTHSYTARGDVLDNPCERHIYSWLACRHLLAKGRLKVQQTTPAHLEARFLALTRSSFRSAKAIKLMSIAGGFKCVYLPSSFCFVSL